MATAADITGSPHLLTSSFCLPGSREGRGDAAVKLLQVSSTSGRLDLFPVCAAPASLEGRRNASQVWAGCGVLPLRALCPGCATFDLSPAGYGVPDHTGPQLRRRISLILALVFVRASQIVRTSVPLMSLVCAPKR